MSVRGVLLWGVCCVCTLRSCYQSNEFIYQGPGLHTGNNNSYGCSRHTPTSTSTPPGPLKTHVCQSHSIHIPFLSPPRPPPRHTHTAPILLIILLLCNCLDDNALHIMAKAWHYIWTQWRQFVYMGHTVSCKVPVMHPHCLGSNAYLAFADLS